MYHLIRDINVIIKEIDSGNGISFFILSFKAMTNDTLYISIFYKYDNILPRELNKV